MKNLKIRVIHKEHLHSVGLSSADILWTRGGEWLLHMQMSILFDAKTSAFLKFMVCLQGQVEVKPVRTRRREGQFFTILCGRPLWIASNA